MVHVHTYICCMDKSVSSVQMSALFVQFPYQVIVNNKSLFSYDNNAVQVLHTYVCTLFYMETYHIISTKVPLLGL